MEHRGTHLKQLKRSKPSCCGKSGDIFTNWISFRSFSRLSTEARNFSFKSIFSLHAQIVSLRIMCLIIVPNPRAFVKLCSRYVQAISLQRQTSEEVHHVKTNDQFAGKLLRCNVHEFAKPANSMMWFARIWNTDLWVAWLYTPLCCRPIVWSPSVQMPAILLGWNTRILQYTISTILIASTCDLASTFTTSTTTTTFPICRMHYIIYVNTCKWFYISYIYIYRYATPSPKIYLFCFFHFASAESIGRLTEKEAAAMARRKREQGFLQILKSDNLAGKGMSEAWLVGDWFGTNEYAYQPGTKN